MSIRPVKRIVQAQPAVEGAGVRLRRAFGFGDTDETDPFLLLEAVREVAAGGVFLMPKIASRLAFEKNAVAANPLAALTPRELEILRLIVHGDSNKHIARALDIAETTVKIHVQHILRKLGTHTRLEAIRRAEHAGLI